MKRILTMIVTLFLSVFFATQLPAVAQSSDTPTVSQEKVLYAFKGDADGGEPFGRLIFDQKGNLYGTTVDEFGRGSNGTVFELVPKAGGGWNKKILYRFQGGTDGFGLTGGLVLDTSGNLYGMTGQGGQFGFGTVYELAPDGKGGWTKTTLHDFAFSDGDLPVSSLVLDQSGNLYGMTPFGGTGCSFTAACGVIFKLTKTGAGWQETVIHYFNGDSGYQPLGALVFDQHGNLYGAASATGIDVDGVAFRLHPTSSGWNYSVLHTFYNAPPKCEDGNFASDPPTLLLDKSGNIYGTAIAGGPYSCTFGTIWRLTSSQGKWSLKVLYAFSASRDGYPVGSLTFDKPGSLYGVTIDLANGGSDLGTVFKLTPSSRGQWSKTVLHYFQGVKFEDGDTPVEAPIFDSEGNLFGTTVQGGFGKGICSFFNGCGVIYQVKP